MAITTLDYAAHRALQRAIHDHLVDVQWDGRITHPAPIGWHDVGAALELAVQALEGAGYRIVADGRTAP